MTIVVGLRDPKTHQVWVGSDSRGMVGDLIWPGKRQKITRCGAWVIGASGAAMNGQVVRECRDEIAACGSAEAVTALLFREFKAREYKNHETSGPPNYDQDLILANHEGVWGIMPNGTVADADYVAMGSGQDYAYGVLHALLTYLPNLSGKQVVEAAIRAAITFDAGCGGDVVVEQVR